MCAAVPSKYTQRTPVVCTLLRVCSAAGCNRNPCGVELARYGLLCADDTFIHRGVDGWVGGWCTQTADGTTTKHARPSSRGHRFAGEATAEGLREGVGLEVFPNGNRYTGSFAADARAGQGTLRFASGSVYEGSFSAGVPEGEGTLKAGSGASFTGEWKVCIHQCFLLFWFAFILHVGAVACT